MPPHEIDFLPASYRQNRHRRARRVWRRAVVGVFLLLVIAGVIGQWQHRQRLERNLAELRLTSQRMQQALPVPDSMKQRLQELDVQAALFASLPLRAAPTRLLASLVNSLPEQVTLTDLEVKSEPAPLPAAGPTGPGGSVPPTGTPAAAGATPGTSSTVSEVQQAAERDLREWQEDQQRNVSVVSLNGLAPDDLAIARYLSNLNRTESFATIQLLYTDQHVLQDLAMRRFSVRLQVRRPRAESSSDADPARSSPSAVPISSAFHESKGPR